MGNAAGGRIAATARPNRLLTIGHLVVWSVAAVVLSCAAFVVHSGVLVVAAGVSALLAVLWGWLGFVGQVAQLWLTPDSLELRRRLRPYSIRRVDVLAVHGNIEGRPMWSDQVVLETATGARPLPGFTERPAELVPLLERWVATGHVARQGPG
ncbi:hypothetical protein [Cellulomonas sp. URHE0023]|uniref:hypothetical protein n=1 Tax=Cellulomonas sp. URHE0023 TaxID=1380354 RepID=UPI0004807F4A|nr:hypothetical protein [Cellulomonas sp. URHE0023]